MPITVKFHVEITWVGRTIVCLLGLGHVTILATMLIFILVRFCYPSTCSSYISSKATRLIEAMFYIEHLLGPETSLFIWYWSIDGSYADLW